MDDNLTLADRIQLGTQFLDETRPGWAGQINLDTLDLASPSSCVIGQLFDDPNAKYSYSAWVRGGGEFHDWLVNKGVPDEDISNAAVMGGFEREGSWEDYHEDLQTRWTQVIEDRIQ